MGIIQVPGNWIPDSLKGIVRFPGSPGIGSSSNPGYEDKLYKVCQMQDMWNHRYGIEYSVSYLSCLDNSISE